LKLAVWATSAAFLSHFIQEFSKKRSSVDCWS